ncbi:MAG: ATP-binding cassette domain-containing protein [Duodenibacillus sp.]|nr:ATP-binding cassette domain-containing protein [Duodenibacillus sp.]
MLRLTDLTIARGLRTLYAHASALANDGEHVALVGENGCGKSSLFSAILGELMPEDGSIEAPGRIAHVAQSVEETELTTLDYVLEGHAELVQARRELGEALASGDAMREAAAIARLAELNEGAVKANAMTILAGLGFLQGDAGRPVRSFSGGWRNRLSLARALIAPSDLLLLDEPTNHLDIDSLIWLEAWIKRLPGTVVIISHDREFLDRTTTATWAIEDGALERYAGNYSFYELQRIERLRLQEAAAKAYQREAAHLTAFIERFRYKATKARQAQSRIKMLDKLQAVEPVRARRRWRFAFEKPAHTPEHLVDLEGAALGYGGKAVIGGATLSIRAGERIGVLGVNGAGKSTLIKGVCGELAPLRGEIRGGAGLVIGYFAQHQLEQLDPEATPLIAMRRKAPLAREQELRDWLGKYKFTGDFADRPAGTMSGGEKARLTLALIAWDRPNLLVLDEPTNHLDMATREALTMALSTFEGTLLLVSHDRHLLRTAVDKLLLVHDGAVQEYMGDLDDYAALVLEHRKAVRAAEKLARAASAPAAPAQAPAGGSRRDERRLQAQERARAAALRKPLVKKLEEAERRMDALGGELARLDALIGDAAWYASAGQDEVAATMKARGEAAAALEEAEAAWMEASEALEAVAQAAA